MKLVPIGDSLVPLVEKLKPYFVQKSGDTMTGSLTMTTHGGSWISQTTAAAPIVVTPAVRTDGNRYDAIIRGTFTDGSSWIFGGIEKCLDFTWFAAGRTDNSPNKRIKFDIPDGRIENDKIDTKWLKVNGDVELKHLIDFHGGNNWSSDFTTRLYAPRNDGELWLQAADGSPIFTTYKGGSPEIYARMYANGEGGNFGWTAPDGSYNELDSWSNSYTRIYNYYGGAYHALTWQRAKDYSLDYMHGWTHLRWWRGTAAQTYDFSDYAEFLVIVLHGTNYLGSVVLQRDWIMSYERELYASGGIYSNAGSGRVAILKISQGYIRLIHMRIDNNEYAEETDCSIYGRR